MPRTMQIGVTLRNMGPQSTQEVIAQGVKHAEGLGFESAWITDHIAIPPDDAEGSGGRYLDTLTTLAWMAAKTERIKVASGVLILPYRSPLPTAKQVATIQELSGNRLLLGVGIGWMDPEFRALGLDRHSRGITSDETLEFLHRCFENDVVSANDQTFLFKPRPTRPPILIGGRAPYALKRAVAFGDGWLPMAKRPEQIEQDVLLYRQMTEAAGKAPGSVSVMTHLPVEQDERQARTWLTEYRTLGVERLVCSVGYETFDEYRLKLDQLSAFLATEGIEGLNS
ncbi:MAG: putative F420-dependent oxidoreductase [Limisphaerales bacterium]|jgi:probable F420-dependent oxidoreductase